MSFMSAPITARIKSGIDIINNIDSQKFPLLLSRVAQSIQSKTDNYKPFSEEDKDRLSTALSVSQPELELILDCLTFLLQQAAFNLMKPAVLQQQLSQVYNLNENKVDIFVSIWTSHAKSIVGALKQKSIYPKQVEAVSWLLNTTVSNSDKGPMLEPRAVIELKLNNADGSKGDIHLDLNQPQLQTLYETLENIQSQLDNLR